MRWQVRGAGAVDGEPRAVFDGASKESASLLAQVGRWALQLRGSADALPRSRTGAGSGKKGEENPFFHVEKLLFFITMP